MLETFLLSIQTGVGWWIWEVDKGRGRIPKIISLH